MITPLEVWPLYKPPTVIEPDDAPVIPDGWEIYGAVMYDVNKWRKVRPESRSFAWRL